MAGEEVADPACERRIATLEEPDDPGCGESLEALLLGVVAVGVAVVARAERRALEQVRDVEGASTGVATDEDRGVLGRVPMCVGRSEGDVGVARDFDIGPGVGDRRLKRDRVDPTVLGLCRGGFAIGDLEDEVALRDAEA